MPPRGERPTLASVIAANPDTFAKLLRYSAALFGLSLGSFLLLSSARLGVGARITGLEEQGPRDVVAAVVGVTVAWLVIAVYVVDAWNEEPDPPQPQPQAATRTAATTDSTAARLAASDDNEGSARAADGVRFRGERN